MLVPQRGRIPATSSQPVVGGPRPSRPPERSHAVSQTQPTHRTEAERSGIAAGRRNIGGHTAVNARRCRSFQTSTVLAGADRAPNCPASGSTRKSGPAETNEPPGRRATDPRCVYPSPRQQITVNPKCRSRDSCRLRSCSKSNFPAAISWPPRPLSD